MLYRPLALATPKSHRVERPWGGSIPRDGAVSYFAPSYPSAGIRPSLQPIAISGDQWGDDVRLSDLEPRFGCSACGKRDADVRPISTGTGHSPRQGFFI